VNIKTFLVFILCIIGCFTVYFWWHDHFRPAPKPITEVKYITQEKIRTVERIKTVKVPGPKEIVTIEKEKVVNKLELPDWVKTDAAKQVIATAQIQPYDGYTDTVAVLDVKTGESEIIAKQVPHTTFGFEKTKVIGVRAGAHINSDSNVEIYGQYNFFRVGKAYMAAYGELDTEGDAKIMLGIEYRW
jgi:hypothetical protein